MSPTCGHCKSLFRLIDKSEMGDSYQFVNVNAVTKLPAFVDRVPLMYDGRDVHTDAALFGLFNRDAPAPSVQAVEPQVAPNAGFDGAFSSSFSVLEDGMDTDPALAGSMWLVDGQHEGIPTPESEPMPSKSDQNASGGSRS